MFGFIRKHELLNCQPWNKKPFFFFFTSLDSVLNYDEDTVDIYSGLEESPKRNKDHGECTEINWSKSRRAIEPGC